MKIFTTLIRRIVSVRVSHAGVISQTAAVAQPIAVAASDAAVAQTGTGAVAQTVGRIAQTGTSAVAQSIAVSQTTRIARCVAQIRSTSVAIAALLETLSVGRYGDIVGCRHRSEGTQNDLGRKAGEMTVDIETLVGV